MEIIELFTLLYIYVEIFCYSRKCHFIHRGNFKPVIISVLDLTFILYKLYCFIFIKLVEMYNLVQLIIIILFF